MILLPTIMPTKSSTFKSKLDEVGFDLLLDLVGRNVSSLLKTGLFNSNYCADKSAYRKPWSIFSKTVLCVSFPFYMTFFPLYKHEGFHFELKSNQDKLLERHTHLHPARQIYTKLKPRIAQKTDGNDYLLVWSFCLLWHNFGKPKWKTISHKRTEGIHETRMGLSQHKTILLCWTVHMAELLSHSYHRRNSLSHQKHTTSGSILHNHRFSFSFPPN